MRQLRRVRAACRFFQSLPGKWDSDGPAHRDVRAVHVSDLGDVDAVHFLGLAGELDAELFAAGVELAEVVGGEPELDCAGGVVV